MKFFIARFIALLVICVAAQTASAQDHPNNIEYDDIRITTKEHKVFLPLHIKQADLVKTFGKPQKIEKWYGEMDDAHGFKVSYQGAHFYFLADSLSGFEFEGLGKFEVGLVDQDVYTCVGGNFRRFKKLKLINDDGAFFNVQHNGIDADELLSFENYKGTGLIQRIIYTTYNANQENDLKLEDLNLPEDPDGKP